MMDLDLWLSGLMGREENNSFLSSGVSGYVLIFAWLVGNSGISHGEPTEAQTLGIFHRYTQLDIGLNVELPRFSDNANGSENLIQNTESVNRHHIPPVDVNHPKEICWCCTLGKLAATVEVLSSGKSLGLSGHHVYYLNFEASTDVIHVDCIMMFAGVSFIIVLINVIQPYICRDFAAYSPAIFLAAAAQIYNRFEKSTKLKIAVVGFGNFGQFLAQTLVQQGHTILAHSRSDAARKLGVSFFSNPDDLCEEHPEVILLCTSIISTESILKSLPVQRLKRNTLFVDVLSVKEFPRNLVENTSGDSFDLYYGLFMYNKNAMEQLERLDMAFESLKKQLFGHLHDVLSMDINISKESPGSPNVSGSISSKEETIQQFLGPELKCRKPRRRKLFEDQEPCIMRGVYLKSMKWQAAIKVDKKQIHLGTVGSQEAAAHLYDSLSKQIPDGSRGRKTNNLSEHTFSKCAVEATNDVTCRTAAIGGTLGSGGHHSVWKMEMELSHRCSQINLGKLRLDETNWVIFDMFRWEGRAGREAVVFETEDGSAIEDAYNRGSDTIKDK
ncbi:hypothetical protein HHK36_027119 [Tetracentron sinense]|uniref:Uncharacterized protein n=1 Tax=Tetracentron sinense TaxID=13715 RepID=A0A834YM42_TETSI|nr:hypothetical protein HHK36_027119 [Tetracentron sinense]